MIRLVIMQDQQRTAGRKAPKTPAASRSFLAHRAFALVVALWFCVALGLGMMVMPMPVIERLVGWSGLAQVLPAASPPLGASARLLLAVAAGAAGALCGFALGRAIGMGHRADHLGTGHDHLRAHRQPIRASLDLGDIFDTMARPGPAPGPHVAKEDAAADDLDLALPTLRQGPAKADQIPAARPKQEPALELTHEAEEQGEETGLEHAPTQPPGLPARSYAPDPGPRADPPSSPGSPETEGETTPAAAPPEFRARARKDDPLKEALDRPAARQPHGPAPFDQAPAHQGSAHQGLVATGPMRIRPTPAAPAPSASPAGPGAPEPSLPELYQQLQDALARHRAWRASRLARRDGAHSTGPIIAPAAPAAPVMLRGVQGGLDHAIVAQTSPAPGSSPSPASGVERAPRSDAALRPEPALARNPGEYPLGADPGDGLAAAPAGALDLSLREALLNLQRARQGA